MAACLVFGDLSLSPARADWPSCNAEGPNPYQAILNLHAIIQRATNDSPGADSCSRYSETQLRTTAPGFSCTTSKGVVFKLVNRTKNGKEVWQDTRSGLFISDVLSGFHSYQDALALCAGKSLRQMLARKMRVSWSLPSGYPEDLNGKHSFPDQNSDYVELEADGFHEVVPRVKDNWFWSSSVTPDNKKRAFDFADDDGFIDYDDHDNSAHLVRCVGR